MMAVKGMLAIKGMLSIKGMMAIKGMMEVKLDCGQGHDETQVFPPDPKRFENNVKQTEASTRQKNDSHLEIQVAVVLMVIIGLRISKRQAQPFLANSFKDKKKKRIIAFQASENAKKTGKEARLRKIRPGISLSGKRKMIFSSENRRDYTRNV